MYISFIVDFVDILHQLIHLLLDFLGTNILKSQNKLQIIYGQNDKIANLHDDLQKCKVLVFI